MPKGKHLTEEQKTYIVEQYAIGRSSVEIAEEVGCHPTHIPKIWSDHQKKTAKSCPKCACVSPNHANFCYHCGTELLTEKDKILRKVESLRSYIVHLPENRAKEFDTLTKEVLDYIKKEIL